MTCCKVLTISGSERIHKPYYYYYHCYSTTTERCCLFRCTVASVQKRHVAIARLRYPAVLGRTCQEVWFIILVVTSTKEVSLYLHIEHL